MGVRNYRDLLAWQKAMDFTQEIYSLTNQFPQDEKFSLTSQLRRAAVSVPSNIAEGEGRYSKPDFKRFLSVAHGSLREAETQILLAQRLEYISQDEVERVLAIAAEVGKLVNGLAKSLDRT